MIKKRPSELALTTARTVLACAFCCVGLSLAIVSFAANAPSYSRSGDKHRLKEIANPNSTSESQMSAGWSIVTPPQPAEPQHNRLWDVTCTSANDCWAVGFYENEYTTQPLIEHWDGSSWSIVASPNTFGYLFGVACNSASDCWAVGYTFGEEYFQPLLEHWDGFTWSLVPSPEVIGDGHLRDVTCNSASDCWAVGYTAVWISSDEIEQTLILHWNGTSWSVVPSPNTSPDYNNALEGVTCTSASDCWAVGDHHLLWGGFRVNSQTFIQHWDGASWVIVPSPNRNPAQGYGSNYLNGVTCASPSQCWAAGTYFNPEGDIETLIQKWNGSSWAIVSSPNNSGSFLAAGTCVSGSDCWVVGHYSTSGAALLEHWNGSSWTIVPSPNILPGGVSLLGVTCTSASDCWAVGSRHSDGFIAQTLVLRWNGASWAVIPSPNNNPQNLHDVACNSDTDCWAVGEYYNHNFRSKTTLIEHWDGTKWTIVNSPKKGEDISLTGVTCISPSSCWAVGYWFDGNETDYYQTLIARWDGTSWQSVPSPNTSTMQHNFLKSVTCSSQSECWAVGEYVNDSGVHQTLIEKWNGTSWAIVVSPNTLPTESNALADVTCASASDCWAVGHFFNTVGGVNQTLVEHWNGSFWLIVNSPNTTGAEHNVLSGVTCVSASDCWAVGHYGEASNSFRTLIEHWNGASWIIVDSPNASGKRANVLNEVTCASASECWAVGYYANKGGVLQTLIEKWDGASWGAAPFSSPNNSSETDNALEAVACSSASRCWAVGYYKHGSGVSQPLIEQYLAELPMLQITAVNRLLNSHFTITGHAIPLSAIHIKASPDLMAPFTTIATVTANAAGTFEFEDDAAGTFSTRFYRAVYPD